MNKIILFFILVCLIAAACCFWFLSRRELGVLLPGSLPSFSREDALRIADQSQEAQAFLGLEERIPSCVVRKILRPCDSDWVTCIDDAWVVEYSLKQECGFVHDGRLSLRLLIDHQGKIISRFPEKEYFLLKNYCMENYDCLPVNGECLNFIYGQLDKSGQNMQECFCQSQECSLR